jgi:class 3 adenylate cyclase
MAAQESQEESVPVTVLFVDICASTTLYAERGDAAAFGLTMRCLDLVSAPVIAEGGRVLRQVGDGILAVFEMPVQGLRAAIRISEITEDPAYPLASEGVRVRSGISSGMGILVAHDVYGDVANVAARLVGRADAGEIFLSGSVYETLPAELRADVQLIDQMVLRNRPTPVLVYKYAPDHLRLTVKAVARRGAPAATMEVTYGDLLLVVGPERPRISLGRDPDKDICIANDAVSRNHAEIVLRGDRFVLIDHSTNGTYVSADNGPMLRLVREEIVLATTGRIVLGVEETSQPIYYRVATV